MSLMNGSLRVLSGAEAHLELLKMGIILSEAEGSLYATRAFILAI